MSKAAEVSAGCCRHCRQQIRLGATGRTKGRWVRAGGNVAECAANPVGHSPADGLDDLRELLGNMFG